MAVFAARCRAAALAVTAQRLAVFRHLADAGSHPSAEQLWARVRRDLPTVSLATVYRTLGALTRIGLVRPVSPLGGRGRWDVNLESHHHLVCIVCGGVTDVTDARLQALEPAALAVASRHRFEAAGHAVEIFGRCASCRRPQSTPPSAGRAAAGRRASGDSARRFRSHHHVSGGTR